MIPPLFVYGTLLWQEVRERILGHRRITASPATISGYKRLRIRDQVYPALVPGSPRDRVTGRLLDRLGREDLAQLDRFEGPEYTRIPVTTDTAISAQAYLWCAPTRLLEPDIWHPSDFPRAALEAFLKRL